MTSAATRLVGVIGWPVSHSLSPAMHSAALAALGLDWCYGAFAVPAERLAPAVAGARALGFVGLNVTIPHKVAVLALCAPDAIATRVGAVNTLFLEGETIRGSNTDVHGFRMLLAGSGAQVAGRRVLVLGAGGAARAVVVALLDDGAEVVVVSRGARPLGLPDGDPPIHPWRPETFAALAPSSSLVVDATARGVKGEAPEAGELALLPDGALVVDLAVRQDTPLLAMARARGLRAVGGAAMLVHQGAAALAAWTGRAAPLDVMHAEIARCLGK